MHLSALLLSVCVSVGVGYYSWRSLTMATAWGPLVRLAREIDEALLEAQVHLTDIETGARGFALTGREPSLESFLRGRAALGPCLEHLRAAVKDPAQAADLAELSAAAARRVEWSEHTIDIRRRRGFSEASFASASLEGKRRMDLARSILARMRRRQNDILNRREMDAGADARRAQAVVLFGSGATGLLALGAGLLWLRESQRRSALERELARRAATTETILRTLGNGVVVADKDGRFTLWNPAAERILGLGARDVAKEEWSRTYGCFLEDQTTPFPPHELPLAKAIRGEPCDDVELFIRHEAVPEGRWVSVSGRPLASAEAGVSGGVAVLQDVTGKRRALEALKAANAELDAFTYSVSHDLRAPLRAIDGFSRMLLEDHSRGLDDEGRRLLGVVRANAAKMGRLIDDLLAFSRLGRKELSIGAVDMSALARSAAADALRERPGSPCQVSVGDLPPARGDAALLHQVFANLIGNAVKYSSKKPAPAVAVGVETAGGETAYCVADNGAGFDMRYAGKLFGVFQRLHRDDEFPGTGVGLALAERIVRRHGGRLWAEGKVGEGAVFRFTLAERREGGS